MNLRIISMNHTYRTFPKISQKRLLISLVETSLGVRRKRGYNNILKCLELLNKIQENPIPHSISSDDCSKHIIELMSAQSAYSDDVNIYVSNIILLYSVDYLSNDVANNTAVNWFLELNERVENGGA